MKCPSCEYEVPEGMAFCGQCGKPVERLPTNPDQPRKGGGKRIWAWVLVGIVAAAIVGGAVFIVLQALEIVPPSGAALLPGPPTQTAAADPPRVSIPTMVSIPPTPTAAPEPLPVPEEVWLTLSGVEVQNQTEPIHIDDDYGYMHEATRQDDFMRFASSGDPEWAGFEAPGFNEGEAVMIRFRFNDDANFVIDFRTETWDTPDTFQWGFVQERSVQLVDHGEYIDDREFQGNLQLEPDAWYYAMLAIDPQGYFTILLWDETYHAMAFERHEYGEDWRDLDWVFHLWVGSGEVDISRMDVYSISGIRIQPSTMEWRGSWSIMGVGGGSDNIWMEQMNGRIRANLNLPGENTYVVEGTAFGWVTDAGWGFDIMRGAILVYPPDAETGAEPLAFFWVDWWLQHSGNAISGSGHAGVSVHCLKRAGIPEYPDNCYWYYYDRPACAEANGDDLGDPEICGTYGEVKEAGLEEEAGFPKPPGG